MGLVQGNGNFWRGIVVLYEQNSWDIFIKKKKMKKKIITSLALF